MKASLSVAVAVGVLTGCATSSVDYAPPAPVQISNTRQVEQPFDVVWDKLVKELSSDFFVINNIDKNSRLINISFTAHRPSDYVDCGRTSRKFTNVRGDQISDYAAADSSNFIVTTDAGAAVMMRRQTKLDGRSNIYVAPSGEGTTIAVNTKYLLSVGVSATDITGRFLGTDTMVVDFSTKLPHLGGTEPNGIDCYARGTVEYKILEAAR